MTLLDEKAIFSITPEPPTSDAWPAYAEMILTALDAGRHLGVKERRAEKRMDYRVRAWLTLFSDVPGDDAREIFTRDVSSRGLGFITPHRLPLGYGGSLRIARPDNGDVLAVHCTILRCKQAAAGWYEGSVYFNRQQPDLVPHSDATP